MFALFSRILKLAGPYKGRIQGAFACAFVESILSKMPIFLAFLVLSGFAAGTLTGQTCLYVGLGLAAAVLVQMLVHYLSDSLQSAAGYLMFAGNCPWATSPPAISAKSVLSSAPIWCSLKKSP